MTNIFLAFWYVGVEIQKRAHIHKGKKKPTQVEKEFALAGRGGVPKVQTPDSQIRTDTEPFVIKWQS